MMDAMQLKMARAALGWNVADLAERAHVGTATIARFEGGLAKPIPATLAAMQRALEEGGVIFLAPGEATDGGPGVRLRSDFGAAP